MGRTARIAIVQFDTDPDNPDKNLRRLQDAVEAHRDADLVVFPELVLHGHRLTQRPKAQARRALAAVPEADVRAFHDFVAAQGTRVVYGELAERGGGLYNLATYVEGGRRVSYAKTHVHWTEAFEAGSDFPVVETPLGPMGMLICFDAAFPEVPRLLALRGAELIVNISAIPDHFSLDVVRRRLVACSVENQVFTVFANRRGAGFRGGSAVVDPKGEVVAQAGATEEALVADVDLSEVARWRREEPLLPNRRPELYGELSKA